MTTPEQAAATSRYTDTSRVIPASAFDGVARDAGPPAPAPVPMTDPIDDVTKPTEGTT